ncbi:MAG: acyltransferase domain-containing protein, partial [Myxococcota bacterium]
MTTDTDEGGLMSVDAIKAWLLRQLAELRGVDPAALDGSDPFVRYGLDSVAVVTMSERLREVLGRAVSPTVFYNYPTVDALSSHLAGGDAQIPPRVETPAARDEPIAIVGRACRFPRADHPQAYWQLLLDGVDATREIPAERWDLAEFHDPDASRPGKMAARRGGFLDRVDGFEPLFFGISPREAAPMDPQQRLMLELSWEALEDAGIVPGRLREQPVGVFVGVMWFDYAMLTQGDRRAIGRYTTTGYNHSIIANRVSYTLGLRGPSMSIDTACSSALSAVHVACSSLQRGESTVALAGGVQLNLVPHTMLGMSKFGGLSPDGRCYSFDARANGYARGEGGGVVVLKRLSRAIRDGDRIEGVIVGSAINNDGASNGLTAPSSVAQQIMLREAYARAGVEPGMVDYVEAHGTGTPLGDPIEAEALGQILGVAAGRQRPLLVGTAKSNIGHLEAAAGVAGLIKASLVLEHGIVPPSVHFETPNPHIDFDGLRLLVPREPTPLPVVDRPSTAGISSFGFGGSNCHVVLQGAPHPRQELLALSAPSGEALNERARAVLGQLAEPRPRLAPDRRLRELCAGCTPGPGSFRLAVSVGTPGELARRLEAFVDGTPSAAVAVGDGVGVCEEGPVFVFSGQGSYWNGMGLSLFRSEPVFGAVLEECDEHIQRHLGWSLLDTLTGVTSPQGSSVDKSGPAIVAIEIALATLLCAWGITPRAVVGHSIGEVAAAHIGGAIDRAQAMHIICTQSRIAARLSGQGGMALVGVGWDEAGALEARFEGQLARAVHASPGTTVLSGDLGALEQARAELEARGAAWHAVWTDVPFHGHAMRQLRASLRDALGDVRGRPGSVPLLSTVSGGRIDGGDLDASYWARNLCDPVLLAEAIESVVAESPSGSPSGSDRARPSTFVEIGPHPILKRSIEECLVKEGRQGHVVATLVRNQDGRTLVLDAVAKLYAMGHTLRWDRLHGSSRSSSGPRDPDERHLLVLSGRTPEACRAVASSYVELLTRPHSPALGDIAHTAARCRTHHPHRAAVHGANVEAMVTALRAVQQGAPHPGSIVGEVSGGSLAFVYSGQGSQWARMGRGLLEREPVFRRALERVAAQVDRWVGWSLMDELVAGEADSRLDQTQIAQPAIFALQVALTALLAHWELVPEAVVGHSIGEVAAAHVAGALGLEDAARLVVHRGRIMQSATGTGHMILAEATVEQVHGALRGVEPYVGIAAINGERAVVFSGRDAELEEVSARLAGQGVSLRRLPVDYAFHSPMMEPLGDELQTALKGLTPRATQRLMISTVTAQPVEGASLDAEYWRRNMRHSVRFADSIDALVERGLSHCVEVGPHPVLAGDREPPQVTGGPGTGPHRRKRP